MDQPLIKLSVSKTGTFESCKKKYEFTYIHKLPRKEFTYHTLGRFVHRVLELFHLNYINGESLPFNQMMSKCFKEALSEKEFIEKVLPDMKKEAFELIKSYLKVVSEQKQAGALPNVLAVEKNFNIDINEKTKLVGMIDRVQIDPDGVIHVVDYKTTKNKKYLAGESFQLLTYAYVLLMEDPTLEKVRGSYILLKHGSETFGLEEYSRDRILAIKDKYAHIGQNIEDEKEFPPTLSYLCRFCDFEKACVPAQNYLNKDFKYGASSW